MEDFFGVSDVQNCLRLLKNNKAVSVSFVTAELLKYCGQSDVFLNCLAALFNYVARNGIPPKWNEVVLTSLFKKGDPSDASNYRGLAVSSVLPKLFAIMLNERLAPLSE